MSELWSRAHRAAGMLMIVAALVYLVPFVPRGWIPHDEGMLGQSADRVLQGAIPHVDYEEAYTGGLSWLYAAVFRISGVDLLHLRWALFLAASAALWLVYAICRRYLSPTAAGLATWVALVWSFPNYFAGLPSWWLLVCALACVWGVIRHVETGRRRHVAAAGLAAGIAITIKQTGVYLLIALVLSLLYAGGRGGRASPWLLHIDRAARWAAAVVAIVAAGAILWPRISETEGLYLFLPAAACASVLFLPRKRDSGSSSVHAPLALVGIALTAAALPVLCLLIPYLEQDHIADFLNGSIVLPRRRLAFASAPMRDSWWIITALPFLGLVFAKRAIGFAALPLRVGCLLWAFAIALPLGAIWNVTSYQFIWQSARAFAALLPLAVFWRLASDDIRQPDQRSILFLGSAMLAWASLNQFPFAAPIYFCYVTPLAVVAGAAAAAAQSSPGRQAMLPWAAMLLLFGVVSANRGYIESLGVSHDPRRFDAALNLRRAHLRVSSADARVYRRLMVTIAPHLRRGQLIAGPDCPQVYFLSGVANPSGALFDFFSASAANGRDADDMSVWRTGEVIVVNHEPHFSPAPSERLLANLRREFQYGEFAGPFEVRWR